MPVRRPAGKRVFWRTKTTRSVFSSRALCGKRRASEPAGGAVNQVIIRSLDLEILIEIKRNKSQMCYFFLYGAKLSYDVRRDFKIESSLAVVRDTAVVLRKKHAVVRQIAITLI